MIYDVIIIGAGPAGLFAACNLEKKLNVLVLEKKKDPGIKLLMTGKGQCNITHGGDIKEFLKHYGENGKRIRQVLYKFNNKEILNYFRERGVDFIEREDGKVFPSTFKASDILSVLLKQCDTNKVDIKYNHHVENIDYNEKNQYFEIIRDRSMLKSKFLIIATGGCSYPTTGSEGDGYKFAKQLGVRVTKIKPSLAPIYTENYIYSELAGLSYTNVNIKLIRDNKHIKDVTGDILFTHDNLSGPVILDLSRYTQKGDILNINYLNENIEISKLKKFLKVNSNIQIDTSLRSFTNFTKRHVDLILKDCLVKKETKSLQISNENLKKIFDKIISEKLIVNKIGGFNKSMATSGGIEIQEIDMKLFSIKKNNRLFFVGEVVDIDGDTGGYNLQFAFASGKKSAVTINNICINE